MQLLLILILTIPTFFRMLKSGVFSMQDFHIFRLIEFNKCVVDFQIPCRWAPDAGLGYGEPLFNYYGQLVYALGQIFVSLGFGYINSIKILFILSIVLSALGMYLLVQKLTKSYWWAIISVVLYSYAPYRAVDIYVRGALPEAFAFVLYPFLTLYLFKLTKKSTIKHVFILSLLLSSLLLIHNLSFLMYMLVFVPLVIFYFIRDRNIEFLKNILATFIIVIGISAFYLLPVIFERDLVQLSSTTIGYFDFRAHFATLKQILFDRSWGYGASLWGPKDDLNLSVGILQWIIPLFVVPFIFKRKIKTEFILFFIIGWVALFLTHNKSTPIWSALDFMAFIQFPWRFLGIAVFCFSLAGGVVSEYFKSGRINAIILATIFAVALFLNGNFFKEDLWFTISDKDLVTGDLWTLQRSASIGDYWPTGAKLPNQPAPENLMFVDGDGSVIKYSSTSNTINAEVKIDSDSAKVIFPVVYFPGWMIENHLISQETDMKLIGVDLKNGIQEINLEFRNTPVRAIGNLISVLTLCLLIYKLWKRN